MNNSGRDVFLKLLQGYLDQKLSDDELSEFYRLLDNVGSPGTELEFAL